MAGPTFEEAGIPSPPQAKAEPKRSADMTTVVRVVLNISRREWFTSDQSVKEIHQQVAAKAGEHLEQVLREHPEIKIVGTPSVQSVSTDF